VDDEDAPSAMGGDTLPKAEGDALGAAVSGDKDGPLRPADVTSPVKSQVPVAPPSIPTAKMPPSLSPKPSPSPTPEAALAPPIKSAVISTVVSAKAEAVKVAPVVASEDAPPEATTSSAPKAVHKPAASATSPPKKAAVQKKPPAAGPSRVYTLQVKAARDKMEADTFVKSLRAKGFKPHLILVDIPEKGRFYRVRLGRFDSMPEARAFQRRYKATSGQPDGGFVTDL